MVGTFSIVAIDKSKNLMGVAVATGSIYVGDRVPWAKSGVGVVATQAYTNTTYGIMGLVLLGHGVPPKYALKQLLSEDLDPAKRQVCMMDSKGNFAVHTGAKCPSYAGSILEKNHCVLVNLIVSHDVLEAAHRTFQKNYNMSFPLRLLTAIKAGVKAGGDKRGHRSAAIKVVEIHPDEKSDKAEYVLDLRCDDYLNPVEKLLEKLQQ